MMTMLGVTCMLLVSVYVTFGVKSLYYGESSFVQIFERLATGTYKTVVYGVRSGGVQQSAAALLGFGEYQQESGGANAHAIPVLTYHAIVEDSNEPVSPESFEGHNVSLSQFEDQMFALKEAGWETVTLEEFTAFVRGERTLPERSFVLTFDDGSKESYYPVDPILRALQYEAVTFILPVLSAEEGTFYYLSENEIERMVDSGRWEVGSHGYDIHSFIKTAEDGSEGAALTNRAWLENRGALETLDEYRARVRADLVDSRSRLEEFLDRPIESFAFPFGEFGQLPSNTADAYETIMDAVADTYESAFYQWWPGSGYTYNYPTDGLLMRRIGVQPTWSGDYLLSFLEGGLPKALPYEDALDRDRGWRTTWGDFSVEDGALALAAAPDSSGASVLLDGTGHWEDYEVEMRLTSPAQTGVTVYLRFADNDNHAVCNFGNGFVHVEQTVAGEQRVIQGTRDPSIQIPEGPFAVTVSVEGRAVTCTLDGGVSAATTFLDPSLTRGGVGIKVWDPVLGESGIELDEFTVSPITNE